MAYAQIVNGDLLVQGAILATGGITQTIARSNFTQEANIAYVLPWTGFRKHDAYDTNLSSTSATVYLALVGGTFGTGVPSLQTSDLKNAGSTPRYARCQFVLPPEYVAGQSITVRLHAGAITTIASTTITVDCECYKSGKEFLVSGSDLCVTSAQSVNSLTFADKDFTITPTGLAAGDELDIRLAILVNDTGTGTAVIGCIGQAAVLLSIKG